MHMSTRSCVPFLSTRSLLSKFVYHLTVFYCTVYCVVCYRNLLSNYMNKILQLIFTRIKNQKSTLLCTNFIVCLSLFVLRHGIKPLYEASQKVQNKFSISPPLSTLSLSECFDLQCERKECSKSSFKTIVNTIF